MGTLARYSKKLLVNNAGFTIIEGLIASAIIGTMLMTAYSLAGNLFKFEKRVKDMTAEDRMIATLVANIRANLSRHQYSFDQSGATMEVERWNDTTKKMEITDEVQEQVMLGNELPIAWSDTDYTSRAACPTCPGSMGYWIQPMDNSLMAGLMKIKVRVKHKRLYPDDGHRDYTFVATFK